MNCKFHHKKIIGVCVGCKTYCCEQCLKENHIQHYQRIVFTQNLIYLCYKANIRCNIYLKEAQEFFKQDSNFFEFLNNQLQMQFNYIEATLNGQIIQQPIEFYRQMEEKIYFQEFYQYLKKESILSQAEQNYLILTLQQKFSEEDSTYLLIKNTDQYCMLLKLGEQEEAQRLFARYFSKVFKGKTIFFENYLQQAMQQSLLKNYTDIEAHQQLQFGRNFLLIQEYEKCITFMDKLIYENFSQIIHDQACVFRGVSLFQLEKLPEALESFQKLKNKDLIVSQLFQCIILERLKIYDKAISQYNYLYTQSFLSQFKKPLCYYLFKSRNENYLKVLCENSIKRNPNDYHILLYQGVLEASQPVGHYQGQLIADRLIQLKPQKLEGHMLKCACLFMSQQIIKVAKTLQDIVQNFGNANNQKILIYFLSLCLFLEGEFERSLEQLKSIKPLQKILVLMNKKDYIKAFLIMMKKYEVSPSFYIMLEEFHRGLNQFNLNEEAFQFIQEQKINGQEKKFINMLLGFYQLQTLGKILFDLKKYGEAYKYFTKYSYDKYGFPFVQFYLGQTLLELNRLQDAAQCFENALKKDPSFIVAPFNFYFYKIVCEIMFGHFEKAQELINLEKNIVMSQHQFFRGFIEWCLGNTEQAYQLLFDNFLTTLYPIVKLLQSKIFCYEGWIMKERNILTASEILIDQIYNEKPELNEFNNKYIFQTNGPYSKFIQRNWAQFDNYEDSNNFQYLGKFFNIKFMALFIETYGYEKFQRNLFINLGQIFNEQLIFQMHRKHQKKQDEMLKTYPFV